MNIPVESITKHKNNVDWKLLHDDIKVGEDHLIYSKSSVILKTKELEIKISEALQEQVHALNAKMALIDGANILERLAREMKSQAEKLH